jgi:nitrate/nitrite-specific signal transduction histidine kinase
MNMTPARRATATALSLAFFGVVATAEDAQIIPAGIAKEASAQERIALSGKLRMLSQRIPAAACHAHRSIDKTASLELLAAAIAEFDRIVNGLEFGDAELNMPGAETDRKVLKALKDLHVTWDPFKVSADALVNGAGSLRELDLLLGQNMDLLNSAKALVVQIVAEYSNPNDMLQSHSMVIDIAGRQRMLSQKISKEACVAAGDHRTAETTSALSGTVDMFEASLNALRHGHQAAGIVPPPNSEISAGLEEIAADWKDVKPLLENVLANEVGGADAEATRFQMLNAIMAKMNTVVGLYASVSDQQS